MDTTNTIELLNNTLVCRLGASPIQGVGVFAIRDIKEGETLYCHGIMPDWYTLSFEDCDRLIPEAKEILLERWPNIKNGSDFLYPDVWLMSYVNHSDTPNTNNDIATRDIKKGEEITKNYKTMENYQEVFTEELK